MRLRNEALFGPNLEDITGVSFAALSVPQSTMRWTVVEWYLHSGDHQSPANGR